MSASTRTGAALLLQQNLRRDRIIAPLVIVLMAVMAYASAAATDVLYKSGAAQLAAAAQIDSQPAIVALYGRILDVHSLGELAMTKMTVLYAAFSSILFIVVVRRHTRVEEESGRAELIGATGIGRDAPLLAAVVEAAAYAVLLGLVVALACVVGGLPAAGSAWFGVIWAGTGLIATGVGAVACQVSASARTCAAVAAGITGAEFVIRAAGDASTGLHWLSWLSPLGWNTQLRAWSGTRPWVALLYVVLAAALLVGAQALRSRRDLDSGLVAARPGRADARPWLAGPLALTLRQQSTALVLWSSGALVMGIVFGAIAPDLQGMLGSSAAQSVLDHLGGQLIAAILLVLAIIISCYAVTVITHAADDEVAGRTEAVLAAAVSRTGWWRATAVVALGGAAWLLLVTGLGLWIGYAAAGGARPWQSLVAALGWIPAVWVMGALALACSAWSAHRAVVGWAWVGLGVLLTLTGSLLQLPGWVIRLSPYSAVPSYPAERWSWTPEIVLLVVAAVIAGGAWRGFTRRDIG